MVDRNQSLTNIAKVIIQNDKEKDTVDVVNATVHMQGDDIFIDIDGSNGFLTPANTQIEVTDKQRVQAEIKNHIVTIVGSSQNVAVGNSSYQRLKSIVADEGYYDELEANGLTVYGELRATQGKFENLEADYGEFKNVVIDEGTFKELVGSDLTITGMLFGDTADFNRLKANNAFIRGILTTSGLVAEDGTIINLESEYADINFAHIKQAAVDNFYSKQARIGNVTIKGPDYDEDGNPIEGTGGMIVSGDVTGVHIYGDVIQAGTLKADTIILKGEDGLYYQLNVGGMTDEEIELKYGKIDAQLEKELEEKLHGSNIIAHTVTAEAVYVDDLSAFNATIGGFVIDTDRIYSQSQDIILEAGGNWTLAGNGIIGNPRSMHIAYERGSISDPKNDLLFKNGSGEDDVVGYISSDRQYGSVMNFVSLAVCNPNTLYAKNFRSFFDVGNFRFVNGSSGNLSLFAKS